MARSCVGDVSLTTFLISSLASQTRLHNHRDRPCGHPEQTRSAADHTTSSVPSNPAQPTTPPPSTNERHSTFERDFKPSTPPTTPRTLTCTTKCLSLRRVLHTPRPFQHPLAWFRSPAIAPPPTIRAALQARRTHSSTEQQPPVSPRNTCTLTGPAPPTRWCEPPTCEPAPAHRTQTSTRLRPDCCPVGTELVESARS